MKQKKKEQNSEQTIFVAWQQGDFFFFFLVVRGVTFFLALDTLCSAVLSFQLESKTQAKVHYK